MLDEDDPEVVRQLVGIAYGRWMRELSLLKLCPACAGKCVVGLYIAANKYKFRGAKREISTMPLSVIDAFAYRGEGSRETCVASIAREIHANDQDEAAKDLLNSLFEGISKKFNAQSRQRCLRS